MAPFSFGETMITIHEAINQCVCGLATGVFHIDDSPLDERYTYVGNELFLCEGFKVRHPKKYHIDMFGSIHEWYTFKHNGVGYECNY